MQVYDFQLLTISATLSCLQLFFECHILSFHNVTQQPSPSFIPRLYHAVIIHVLAHALTTHFHFSTVSNIVSVSFTPCRTSSLWPPYGIGQAVIFLSCGFFFLSSFFSLPIFSRHRLHVYHTSTHAVALVRI